MRAGDGIDTTSGGQATLRLARGTPQTLGLAVVLWLAAIWRYRQEKLAISA